MKEYPRILFLHGNIKFSPLICKVLWNLIILSLAGWPFLLSCLYPGINLPGPSCSMPFLCSVIVGLKSTQLWATVIGAWQPFPAECNQSESVFLIEIGKTCIWKMLSCQIVLPCLWGKEHCENRAWTSSVLTIPRKSRWYFWMKCYSAHINTRFFVEREEGLKKKMLDEFCL